MNLRELPWTWIGAAVAVLLAVALARARTGRRRRGDGWASVNSRPDAGPAAAPEQRALLQAANEVRGALERQATELSALRISWNRRMDELERKIGALAPAGAPPREDGRSARPGASAARGGEIRDGGTYAGGTHDGGTHDTRTYEGGTMQDRTMGATYDGGGGTGSGMIGGGGYPSPEPAWSPGPGDQPVEVREGALVVSRSLPPAGYLSVTGAGQARVYLNADVQLTEFSLPKWAAFFDLQGARPYAAYRTRRPAEVRWDEGAGRGELIHKGLAEAI